MNSGQQQRANCKEQFPYFHSLIKNNNIFSNQSERPLYDAFKFMPSSTNIYK